MAVYSGLLLASLLAFGHIVEDYLTGDPLVDWDVRFAGWLHEHASGDLVTSFRIVTFAGNGVFLLLVAAGTGVWLWRRHELSQALLVAVVFVGGEFLNLALKLAFQRPRPELAFVHLETYSFPSGHAMMSAAVYGLLAVLALPLLTTLKARVGLVSAVVLLVALIAFCRLYLGVHYLSDVLAGVSVGAAWLMACLLAFELHRARRAVR